MTNDDKRMTPRAEAVLAQELPALEDALKRILDGFDLTVTPCGACGLKVAQAYQDLKAAEAFSGMLRKVQAYRTRIG